MSYGATEQELAELEQIVEASKKTERTGSLAGRSKVVWA